MNEQKLKYCGCDGMTEAQLLFNYKPGSKLPYAVECPYCGKHTTWRKTEKAAVLAWNTNDFRNTQMQGLKISLPGVFYRTVGWRKSDER